ncbi:hypothetical protein [uncultured Winogradskyella sp.]|nr:hypothetical protein [uncultured Winogradskyella sp.]
MSIKRPEIELFFSFMLLDLAYTGLSVVNGQYKLSFNIYGVI